MTFTISELARQANVPATTVRYYERRGLLRPDGRSESNYRLYGRPSVERLRFIRAAQSSGFTLKDVSRLLELRDGSPEQCGEVRDLIGERLVLLDRQLAKLAEARTILSQAVEQCEVASRDDSCHVVDELRQASRLDVTPPGEPRHKKA